MKTSGKSAESERRAPVIFVVDDEPLVAEVVETILDLDGYRTRVFLQPREALEAIENSPVRPDLLLTDYKMPEMTGLELIRLSKQRFPDLKTILFSGYVDENIFASQKTRPDMFMRKPFYPENLLGMIRSLIPPEETTTP